MFEPFTDRARKIMQLANKQAQRFNHEYIGTQHILLGLAQEGNGVAVNVLKNLHVDLSDIRQAVEELAIASTGDTKGKLRLTPEANRVIQYAMAAARELNHNHIGSEHLLLGLLREQDGVAAQALANLEVTLDQTTAEILNLWGRGLSPASHENTIQEPLRRRGPLWMVLAVFAVFVVASVAGVIFLLRFFAERA